MTFQLAELLRSHAEKDSFTTIPQICALGHTVVQKSTREIWNWLNLWPIEEIFCLLKKEAARRKMKFTELDRAVRKFQIHYYFKR